MRIKGPTNGAPPVDGVGEVDGPDRPNRIDKAEGPAATSEVGATAPAKESQALDSVSQVASQLRAGQITVDQAVERLIGDTVAKHLGADPDKMEKKLRELLRSYAENDPFLAARIRRLTLAK